MMVRIDKRFWESTRGRLVILLRRKTHTVSELAAALNLTDNAVRSHLTNLERDGLVRVSGTRRGPRKPTVMYDLSTDGEQLFPKAYGPILRHLLDVLSDELSSDRLEAVMRAVGHRVAGAFRPLTQAAKAEERIERATGVLRDLGGCCDAEEANGAVVLRCFDCPLAAAVDGHPEVCKALETVLTDVLAIPVRQRCETSPPRCRFEFERRPRRLS
jgi:predicted ArsR family transcriptional regulator